MSGIKGDHPFAAFALFIVALVPGRSRAEGSSNDGDAQLGTVVVPAPTPAPTEAERSPASFSRHCNAPTIWMSWSRRRNLIAGSPGAVLHSYGGPGQLTTLSLRGSSSQEV